MTDQLSKPEQELIEKFAARLYLFDDKPFKDESHYKLATAFLEDVKKTFPELVKDD